MAVATAPNPVIDRLLKPKRSKLYSNIGVQVKGEVEADFADRLFKSMGESDKVMRGLNTVTRRLMRKFVGTNTPNQFDQSAGEIWSDAVHVTPNLSRPLNNLYLYATTLVPLLVMTNPTPEITSPVPELRPIAYGLTRALTQLYREIAFDDVIRRAVFRCIFGLSVIRTGIASGGEGIMEGGMLRDNGQPFVESFGSERFRFDPRARVHEDCRWMGHHYQLPADFFRESGLYERTDRAALNVGPQGDPTQSERQRHTDPYQDQVHLFDAWLAEGNPLTGDPVIVTLSTGGHTRTIHRIAPYEGDERGPYEIISLTPILDSVVPLPPANLWESMDQVINDVARKMHNQIRRQKDITFYDRAIDPDEKSDALAATDGAWIATSDPTRYNQVHMGGTGSDTMAALELLRRQSSEIARNIDQLGGTRSGGANATATEVATLQANANVSVEDMIGCVHKAVERTGRKLLWYLFNDPFIHLPMTKRDHEGNAIETVFTSEQIEGDFMDYNFRHRLYSMQRLTPEKAISNWMLLFNQVLMPSIPLLQQQGVGINAREIIGDVSRLLQIPDIDRIWQAPAPAAPGQVPVGRQVVPVGTPPAKMGTNLPAGAQFAGGQNTRPAVQMNITAGGQASNAPVKAAPVNQGG